MVVHFASLSSADTTTHLESKVNQVCLDWNAIVMVDVC